MTSFDDLATAAALGTANRNPDRTGWPADDLLDVLGIAALSRRAQTAAGPGTEILALPASDRRPAPPELVALLRRMAGSKGQNDILREALAETGRRGFILPADLLILLLETLPRQEFTSLVPVLDDRSRALVLLNPLWSANLPAAGELEPRLWLEGKLEQRVTYLQNVRAADPAAGLALVQDLNWRKETAPARSRFVQALRNGASPADEEFLESCLDDRSVDVRRAAVQVLRHIPGSAYLGRAEALAASHLTLRKKLLGSPKLIVEPFEETEQTIRDQYPVSKSRTKAAVARDRIDHIIELIPTSHWPAILGATAAELATMAAECEGKPYELGPSWARAAQRWKDVDLARQLLAKGQAALDSLVSLLPAPERTPAIVAKFHRDETYQSIQSMLPTRFDRALAVGLCDELATITRSSTKPTHSLSVLADALALRATVEVLPQVAARLQLAAEQLSSSHGVLRNRLFEAAATAQLRAGIYQILISYPVADPDQEHRP